jgi:hypothetical membrane protein
MERVLILLFVFQSLGLALFGKFQTETAWWKQVTKWMVILLIVSALYALAGEIIAIVTLPVLMLAGVVAHIIWCKRNGIHPMDATPRKKYYRIRAWDWKE